MSNDWSKQHLIEWESQKPSQGVTPDFTLDTAILTTGSLVCDPSAVIHAQLADPNEKLVIGSITFGPSTYSVGGSHVSAAASAASQEKIKQLETKVAELEKDKHQLTLTLNAERHLRHSQNSLHLSEIATFEAYRDSMCELLFALTVDLESGALTGGTSEAAKRAWDKLLPIVQDGDLEKLTARLKSNLKVLRG